MIETLFSLDALGTPAAFLLAFLIGLGFGTALEQAGFGSSRRLSGIFYFRDMTVLKVMFTAVITAMLGLLYCFGLGILTPDRVHILETFYGAQALAGMILGIGFVMGGWCPGTAAVGLASGRLDALLFLIGAMAGSLLFNEGFATFKPLLSWGQSGVVMAYDVLGMTRETFGFAFTLVAVLSFWGSEFLEEWQGLGNLRGRFGSLVLLTLAFLVAGSGLFLLPRLNPVRQADSGGDRKIVSVQSESRSQTPSLFTMIEQAEDHFEPEELADRLVKGDPGLTLVDLRSPGEFGRFHLRGAVNLPLSAFPEALLPWKNRGILVLYSNGMTHPAQARDLLHLQGFNNVYLLTDGLKGFMERCLKPVSLREEPVPAPQAARITAWREFFKGKP